MQLPFTSPWLLAPMEGVTESAFRDHVLARNDARALGGTFTEFVRVSQAVVPPERLREQLVSRHPERPVGLQLMGSDAGRLAETAAGAREAGAVLVDLNFGCPTRRAIGGCAGSALLDHPETLEAIVRAVAQAAAPLPTTAKIRAGGEDDSRLEEIAAAAEAGGARLLSVHCRTRREKYADTADWERLCRAVAAVSIPVCGNGGVESHADLERLRRETGCRYAMVGRAALADPWIFSGRTVSRTEAACFLLAYAAELAARAPDRPRFAASRVKQLFNYWTAGGLVRDEKDRRDWLRSAPETLMARLEAAAGRTLAGARAGS